MSPPVRALLTGWGHGVAIAPIVLIGGVLTGFHPTGMLVALGAALVAVVTLRPVWAARFAGLAGGCVTGVALWYWAIGAWLRYSGL